MVFLQKQMRVHDSWIRPVVLLGLAILLLVAFRPVYEDIFRNLLAEKHPLALSFEEPAGGNTSLIFQNHQLDLSNQFPSLVSSGLAATDIIHDVVVTDDEEIIIVGETYAADFPTYQALQENNGGQIDGFVSKISADGQSLLFSTYLGGAKDDAAYSLDLDAAGNIYVGGRTQSLDFPVVNSFQSIRPGIEAAFITVLSPDGQTMQYSTYLGGQQPYPGRQAINTLNGLVVDAAGSVYAAGWTFTDDFPVVNPLPFPAEGAQKVFISRLAPGGQQLLFSTTFSVWGFNNLGEDIALDGQGNIYFLANSDGGLPVVNPIQSEPAGFYDTYVGRISADGDQLEYATYLGGSHNDFGNALHVDAAGNAYILGTTSSTDFPLVNAFQGQNNGSNDVFLLKVDESGTSLDFSTYFGGNSLDLGYALAIDQAGRITIGGRTNSSDFPLANAWQDALMGPEMDGFISTFSPAGNTLLISTYLGGNEEPHPYYIGIEEEISALAFSGPDDALVVAGFTNAADFPVVQPLFTHRGFIDGFVSRFDNAIQMQNYGTFLGGAAYPEPTDVRISDFTGESNNLWLSLGVGLMLLTFLGFFLLRRRVN